MKESSKELLDVGGVYERHALDWDADRNRRVGGWPEEIWHRRFVAALQEGALEVLDLGCGSGFPVAAFLAAHGLRVTGVDAAPSLIALCRERLPDHSWIVGDMRAVDLARRFDGILAWDSFFHLPPDDQRAMFAVFARHAAAGAVLMFNTGGAYGEAVGEYRGDPLYHASLDAAEYRTLLAGSGFDIVSHVPDDVAEGGGRTVWLARRR